MLSHRPSSRSTDHYWTHDDITDRGFQDGVQDRNQTDKNTN